MKGYIYLHRKMLDWEWYKNINAKVVFLHCLLRANTEDTKVNGIEIKRGQFITSINTLVNELSLSKQQIRNTLTNIQATNNITQQTTNKYRLITVVNYDLYQIQDKKTTSKTTSKPTPNNNIYIDNSKYVSSEEEQEEKYDKSWLGEVLKKCDNLPNIKRLRGES